MAYIGNSPENIQRGRRAIYEFTSTAGQTVYTGLDDNNQTLDLLEANEQSVFLNGIRLVPTDDYTVSGDTLTLTSAASLNDHMIIETQTEVGNAVTYTRAESDARYINYDGDIVAGDLQISGEVDAGSLIVDTDVLVVDAVNNRVGVGTSSPTEPLDVSGGKIRIGNTKIGHSGSGGSWDMAFETYSGGYFERVRIDSVGNVGIGTNTPNSYSSQTTLTINGATYGRLDLEQSGSLKASLFATTGSATLTTTTNILSFDTSGGEAMRIIGSGNVGIGTTNPSQIFEVQKAANDKLVYGSNPRLLLDTPTGINGLRVLGDTTPFEFKIDSGTYNGSTFSMGGTGDVSLLGTTTTASDTFNDSPTFFFNSMRWNGSANATHFQGAIKGHTRSATNGDGYLGIGANANANHLNIDASTGNVGIGTTSPGTLLHLNSASDTYFTIGTTNVTADARIQFRNSGGTDAGGLWYATSGNNMLFRTNSAERMRIKGSGAVSISPSGYVTHDSAQQLTIGSGTTATGAGLSIIRGEALSGGTGPNIRLYHGPDGGTQVQHQIYSFIGDLIISADAGNVHSGTTMEFNIDGNRRLLLNGSGNLIMNNGSGIDFSATGNSSGSTTTEILDDYEEGTWTASLHLPPDSLTNTNATAATNRYTKIGNMVTVQGRVVLSGNSSSGSAFRISGLPFTTSTNTAIPGTMISRYGSSFSFVPYTYSGTTEVHFYEISTSGNWNQVSYNEIAAIDLHFQLTYFAT